MATKLIRGIHNLNTSQHGCVVAIGNFDGVHKGHRALLAKVQAEAKKRNVPSTVIIFEPQPLEYFDRGRAAPRLSRFREKFTLLAKVGIDQVFVIRFNKQFAAMQAEEFVKEILCQNLGMKHIIVGEDFHFGQARQGNVALLKEMSQQCGFTVEIMPSFLIEEERVSSTRVRKALAEANHSLAEKLLGQPYFMMGRVVYGAQLGRVLGFPTANIYLHRHAAPVQGIYIVRLHGLTEKGLPGVANIGIRPAVGGTRSLLEVYIFNFNENIYGKYVSVEFCKKLREEENYANLDLLKAQIQRDADQARAYFIARGEMIKNESEKQ